MRVLTERKGQGYNEYLYQIDNVDENVVIRKIGIQNRASRLMMFSDHDNCIQISMPDKIIFHGESRRILSKAKEVTGYTYKLDKILRPLGFKWVNAQSKWMKSY